FPGKMPGSCAEAVAHKAATTANTARHVAIRCISPPPRGCTTEEPRPGARRMVGVPYNIPQWARTAVRRKSVPLKKGRTPERRPRFLGAAARRGSSPPRAARGDHFLPLDPVPVPVYYADSRAPVAQRIEHL